MSGRLAGKVAIVSGAARGIGAGCARALAEEGASVVVTDLLSREGQATAAQIRDAGGRALFLPLDVTDVANWNSVVEESTRQFGGIDVLVNNAGIDIAATIEDARIEDFRRIIEINLFGGFHGIQAVIPAMKARGGGSIINMSSLATIKVAPTTAIYGASKAALENLTRTAALHCRQGGQGGQGIRINSVHPGIVETAMTLGENADAANVQRLQPLADATPAGRLGQPSDIGSLIVYLASDESSFITGSAFVIDGGLHLI